MYIVWTGGVTLLFRWVFNWDTWPKQWNLLHLGLHWIQSNKVIKSPNLTR